MVSVLAPYQGADEAPQLNPVFHTILATAVTGITRTVRCR
ncbi:hypothetical protein SAMN06272727_6672 [Streptomyces sp. Ag82_G6-1]|nr:hypothetical protein SAMN06272727_6672 [Streptomyces sp. Ag82_G6-1]